MKRGEVWWADLDPPAGRRPVVLLSRDETYRIRSQATVAQITTRIRGIPVEVLLGPDDGLPERCVVNLDNLSTIALAYLDELIAPLDDQKLRAVEDALHFALGLRY